MVREGSGTGRKAGAVNVEEETINQNIDFHSCQMLFSEQIYALEMSSSVDALDNEISIMWR